MRFFSILVPALAVLAACSATTPMRPDSATATYIVVRHAEKNTDDTRDPELSPAGRARAESLSKQLSDRPLVAAYATDFRRTRQTAAPAATASGVEVTVYDAAVPATDFGARLRREQPTGTTLIVGHSNTVPDIVAALCDCTVAPIDETRYGDRFDVRVDASGAAHLSRSTY